MFVSSRVLEVDGKLTLLDQNKSDRTHPYFPHFCNRQPLLRVLGAYHGSLYTARSRSTKVRWTVWSLVARLNYLSNPMRNADVVSGSKNPSLDNTDKGRKTISSRWSLFAGPDADRLY